MASARLFLLKTYMCTEPKTKSGYRFLLFL